MACRLLLVSPALGGAGDGEGPKGFVGGDGGGSACLHLAANGLAPGMLRICFPIVVSPQFKKDGTKYLAQAAEHTVSWQPPCKRRWPPPLLPQHSDIIFATTAFVPGPLRGQTGGGGDGPKGLGGGEGGGPKGLGGGGLGSGPVPMLGSPAGGGGGPCDLPVQCHGISSPPAPAVPVVSAKSFLQGAL